MAEGGDVPPPERLAGGTPKHVQLTWLRRFRRYAHRRGEFTSGQRRLTGHWARIRRCPGAEEVTTATVRPRLGSVGRPTPRRHTLERRRT